jgi:hypothetical protein
VPTEKEVTMIAAVMDAICQGVVDNIRNSVIESSDNDNDSGEVYSEVYDQSGLYKYTIKVNETERPPRE